MPTLRRRRLFLGSSPFNPLTDPTMPLLAGLWADDLALADGASVASWPNRGSIAGDPAQATSLLQPVLRKNPAGFNGHAAVEFTAASLQVLDVVWIAAQPLHIVTVHKFKSNASTFNLLGYGGSTARGLRQTGSGVLNLNYGTNLADGNTSLLVAVGRGLANGASSAITTNEAAPSTGSASTGSHVRLTLGAASDAVPTFGAYLDGFLAFVGIASATAVSAATASDYARKLMTMYGIAA